MTGSCINYYERVGEGCLEKGYRLPTPVFLGFPGGSDGKESACNVGHLGSIPGLGRSPGGGHSNPLQCSCLENPHGQRSLAGYSPRGCTELDTTVWLSTAQGSADRQAWGMGWRKRIVSKLMWCPHGTSGKDPACQWRRHKWHGFDPWVGKTSWRRA